MRITESKLRRIIRSVIVESSKSKKTLYSREEIIDAFSSIVDEELEKKFKRFIELKKKGRAGSAALRFGKKLRSMYKEKYIIDNNIESDVFRKAVTKGLNAYISKLQK